MSNERPEGAFAPAAGSPTDGYLYDDLAEYESIIGCKVNEAFRLGWNMARLTRRMVGLEESENDEAERTAIAETARRPEV